MPEIIIWGATILTTFCFCGVFLKERRNLLVGILFVLNTILLLFAGVSLINQGSSLAGYGITLVSALLFILVLMGPLVISIIFIVSGIKVVSTIGFNLQNILSLTVGLLMLAKLIGGPILLKNLSSSTSVYPIYGYVTLIQFYLMSLASAYTLSSWLNQLNPRRPKLDYIIVLGAYVSGQKVSPILKKRLDRAIEVYKKIDKATMIMSGGQGADEVIPEALAMRNYALEQGIPEEDILMEDQSTNTKENIEFSNRFIPKGARCAIVTNDFHVFRALLLSKRFGMKAIGYGARGKFLFSINYFVREFIGYLNMNKSFHLKALSLLSLLYWGGQLFLHFVNKGRVISL